MVLPTVLVSDARRTFRLSRPGPAPLIRHVAGWVYRRIARHRRLAGRLDLLLLGPSKGPSRHHVVNWVFLRGLGLVSLVAFTSLRAQVLGLYGSRGLQPIRDVLEGARARRGHEPSLGTYSQLPTVFWLGSSDRALLRACTVGQSLSVALMLGIAPRWVLGMLWASYLSFVSVGREFLAFQWDVLLLETSLCALLAAPPGLRPKLGAWEPPGHAVLLLRWLAFRLHFQSGLAKLCSGDPTWRNGTACHYHFETQPLPTRVGWYAHQLPSSAHKVATAVVLCLECCVPFLAFAPRRLRRASYWLLAGLQGTIALTGSYGFFNLLTVVDMLWLLDDDAFRGVLKARPIARADGGRPRGYGRYVSGGAAGAIFLLSALAHAVTHGRRLPPRFLLQMTLPLSRLRSINTYGLFAVMTTERPEIIIEGSEDGVTWLEYRFRYKPTDPTVAPRWVAPHQPRLDWQLWFAALASPPRWFLQLLVRLLQASPDVLALLRSPFGASRPRYVRALLYRYEMTDLETRRRSGAWWRREKLGTYFPAIALREGA